VRKKYIFKTGVREMGKYGDEVSVEDEGDPRWTSRV